MITIWMPVHNEEKHISSAIESVLDQSYSNFQLIISNNFSTDSSAEIIDRYSKKDSRIVKVSPKKFYSSTAHAEFLLSSILPLYSNKYSINIGAHDIWDPLYLQILFQKAEQNPDASIIYGQGFDLSYDNNHIFGKFDDHIVCAEILKPFIPHVVLLSLRVNTVMYGLMLENKRRKCELRHFCSGWDHLMVAEMALLGKILFEPSAKFYLRRSKDHGVMSAYKERHLNHEDKSIEDFMRQLEWACYLVDKSTCDYGLSFFEQPQIKNMLKISLIYGYVTRYITNLNFFGPTEIQKFLCDKNLFPLYEANLATSNFIDQLIADTLGGKT